MQQNASSHHKPLHGQFTQNFIDYKTNIEKYSCFSRTYLNCKGGTILTSRDMISNMLMAVTQRYIGTSHCAHKYIIMH